MCGAPGVQAHLMSYIHVMRDYVYAYMLTALCGRCP